ncbi:MAG TPA: isochorismatase family protein [Casimicrobiaceae bacterium]|jgi:nicotinamidase-related amidase|nr:isochorismatase family protein [Casimicrobiaceae bacterium]
MTASGKRESENATLGPEWCVDGADLYRSGGIGGRVGFGRRPAILVVDLIRGCTEKDSPLPPLMNLDAEVANTKTLLDVARLKQVPVIFTTLGPYREDMREVGPIAVKMPGIRIFTENSPWAEVDARLEMRSDEFLVRKKWQSAFFGTDLQAILVGLGVDTLIVMGCVTSGCVRATVTDAASHGYRIIMPRDCIGDRTRQIHEANLFDLNAKNGDVVGLEEVVTYLHQLSIPAG